MFRRFVVSAALAVVVAGAAQPAAAVTRELTFYGEVVSLFDPEGFYPAFGTLQDRSFTAVASFDLPSSQVTSFSGAQVIRGGSQIVLPSAVSGRLTFGGLTYTFADNLFGVVGVGSGEAAVQIRGSAAAGGVEQLDLLAQLAPSPLADLGADFDIAIANPIDTGSGFTIRPGAAGDERAIGVLFVNRVTLGDAVVAGVPEPGVWALMIGGFGMAGAALRARRRVAV